MLDVQSQVSNFMFSVSLGPGKLPMMLGAKLHIFEAKMDEILVGNCIFWGFQTA